MTRSSIPIVILVLIAVAVLLWVVDDNDCGTRTSNGLFFTCSTPGGPGAGDADDYLPPRPVIEIHPAP